MNVLRHSDRCIHGYVPFGDFEKALKEIERLHEALEVADPKNAAQLIRLVSQRSRAVVLSDDERKALVWAARRGAALLRAEGWPDMRHNAEILDAILPRLEEGQQP